MTEKDRDDIPYQKGTQAGYVPHNNEESGHSIASVAKQKSIDAPDYAVPVPDSPTSRLSLWLQEASVKKEVNHTAMALSTINSSGAPRVRFVLCKGVTESGLRFFTNLQSEKAMDIKNDNRVAAAFYWPNLERQVRIEGTVSLISDEEADAYFATRDRLSQLGAWASQQSRPIASRRELEAAVQDVSTRFEEDIPRPPHWSGFHLHATVWEFWQEKPGRIHDRWILKKAEDEWLTWRLQP